MSGISLLNDWLTCKVGGWAVGWDQVPNGAKLQDYKYRYTKMKGEDGNGARWDGNGARWDGNGARWGGNGARWDGNGVRCGMG